MTPPGPQDLPADAESWFARMHAGAPPSQADESAFETWLGADPDHARQYRACQTAWLELGLAAGAPDVLRLRASALRRAGGGLRRRDLAIGALAAAAGAALLVAYGPQAQGSALATDRGQRLASTLPDGSRVTLAPQSRMRMAYTDEARTLVLERGQGFFDVSPDASRPFRVIVGDYVVTAHGTKFQVSLREGDVNVVLEEGVIGVTRRNGDAPERRLTAGQKLAGDLARAPLEPADIESAAAWRAGRLVFRDKPLIEVAREFNRYSRDRLIIADEAAGAVRISGAFDYDGARAFALAVEQSFPVRAEQTGAHQWRLSSRD